MCRCVGRPITVSSAETEQFALIYAPLIFATSVLTSAWLKALSGERSRDAACTTSQHTDCCAAALDCRSKCLTNLFGGGRSEGVRCGAEKVSPPICTARCIARRQAILFIYLFVGSWLYSELLAAKSRHFEAVLGTEC